MDLLLLGGTAFLGREIAARAVTRGWRVTCLARGVSGAVPEGARLVHADRDREDGLAGVAGHRWDAVVDVARQPGHVRRAVRDLSAEHFVFVSTGNVYADTATAGLGEDAALLEPLAGEAMADMDEYGAAKVACEELVRSSASFLIARAGLIGGPGDWSGRTGYWPWRFAHPATEDGAVLAPDAPDQPVQIVDVRDLAEWLLDCAAEGTNGVFNATGDTTTLGHVLDVSRRVAGHSGPVVTAGSDWLLGAGVAEWMGPRSLPLWLADPGWRGFQARDNARARAAGLAPRPLAETLRDTLAWEQSRTIARSAGLTDADERELLDRLS